MSKKKQLKKSILSGALVIAMLASMTPAVMAANDEPVQPAIAPLLSKEMLAGDTSAAQSNEASTASMDEQLAKSIAIVKKNIEIDEEIYTNFSYNTYNYTENTISWSLQWTAADHTKSIYAQVVGDELVSFDRYEQKESQNYTFAKITKAQAQEKALEFAKKMMDSDLGGYDLYSSSLNYYSDVYSVTLAMYKDGYINGVAPMINVNIDKITGEVRGYYNYSNRSVSDVKYNYQDASKVISVDEAKKAYADKIGLNLVYRTYYDYSTKKLSVFPIYRTKDNAQYINAVTGEAVQSLNMVAPSPYQIYGDVGEAVNNIAYYDALTEETKMMSYSVAEQIEIDKIKDFLTKEQAIEIFMKTMNIKQDDLKDVQLNSNLSQHYINQNQYIWNINYNTSTPEGYYVYRNAEIDARDGTIISYNNDDYATIKYGITGEKIKKENWVYTYAEAKKLAVEQIGKYAAKYGVENFELTTPYYVEPEADSKEAYFSFSFSRKVNGIAVDENNVYISINNINGTIASYSLRWYEDAEFPAIDKVVSPESIIDKMIKYGGYAPVYAQTKFDEATSVSDMSLVYALGTSYLQANAFTGEIVGWDGKPSSSAQYPEYSDVKGHWSEEVVTTLLDNGISAWGGEFLPDKAVTTQEFISLMNYYVNSSGGYYYQPYQKVMASYLYVDNVLSDEKANVIINRQDAMKIICELMNYDKIADHPEYFLYPFTNGNVDESYKGYVTICYLLGAIRGNGTGAYDATVTLTRAEAAQILYNLLTK